MEYDTETLECIRGKFYHRKPSDSLCLLRVIHRINWTMNLTQRESKHSTKYAEFLV